MADDISDQNKLKQIISRLSIHCNLTGEDIADVLWLALKQKEYSATELQENVPPVKDKPKNQKQSNSPIVNDIESEPLQDSKSSTLSVEEPSAPIYPASQDNSSSSTSQKTIPLRHPDPPSLQQPLEFAKTLRPLIRRVDSGRKTVLDEVETVKRTAEEGICIPILKSESEPWLDLALVVDENRSMIIWRNTVKELKQLLEHYGIFREVRTWGLTTDKEGDITLRVQVGQKESCKNPQELIDPTHRRLILIVSDCVAPIWFDGTILSTLEDWTKHQPMAIVQMLPDSMWLRTGLRLGASVELVNLIPGAANRNLRIHELLLWKDINLERGTKIPVLTLNPEVTSLWSDFLVGKYDRVMAGFVIPSASDFTPPPQLAQSRVKELDAKQRVERFRKISSPLGRKLAGLLMAAPVITLPVVRIIQKTLLPESQPVHVAEVFLGGLLKPLTEITTDTNPDGVLFDVMHDGIRDILLDDAPFSDSEFIFGEISDYIESQLGKSLRECVGLLKTSSKNGEEETIAKAYAEISLKILKGLGGSYQDFAEELEKPSTSKSRNQEEPDKQEIADKILTFEVATIEIQETRTFEFYVATLERQSQPRLFGLLGEQEKWVINRQQQQGTAIIEVLEPDVELELIEIPGGSFMMGSPEDEGDNSEKPQHKVTIQPFFMGKFQVTQAQWQIVMGNNPARFQDSPLHPVERVSWEEAVEFCDRLSQKTGKEYRLPTEAEWEYACRAGTTTPFHFGETISTELANYNGEATYGEGVKGEYRKQTTPVGYFKVANNFGLYDMHGNVFEWCEDDWHENYQDAPTDGTAWLSGNSGTKVVRGGSWLDIPGNCRSAYRIDVTREDRYDVIGFRVVCVASRAT